MFNKLTFQEQTSEETLPTSSQPEEEVKEPGHERLDNREKPAQKPKRGRKISKKKTEVKKNFHFRESTRATFFILRVIRENHEIFSTQNFF